jgi:hypothetical protein
VDLYGGAGFDVLCLTDHPHPWADPAAIAFAFGAHTGV